MKTETVQTRQLLWISECTHTHRTGYFIMKIVQQGLYIHGKVRGKQRYLALRLANKQWILVLWLRLNSALLANQIEFLDMFWLFDGRIKNILYFREFVNQLFEVWPTCRQEFPCELGGRESRSESKKEEWRSFLSLSLTLQKSAVYQNFTPPPKKIITCENCTPLGNNNF